MVYTFSENTSVSPRWVIYSFPSVNIEEGDLYGSYFQSEVNLITDENHLKEIVFHLQELINGKIKDYTFGYEVYAIVCDHEFCRCNVVLPWIERETDGSDAVIPINEVLLLMKDWSHYLLEWKRKQEEKWVILREYLQMLQSS